MSEIPLISVYGALADVEPETYVAGQQIILAPRREASRIRRLVANVPNIAAVYAHDYLPPGKMLVVPLSSWGSPLVFTAEEPG